MWFRWTKNCAESKHYSANIYWESALCHVLWHDTSLVFMEILFCLTNREQSIRFKVQSFLVLKPHFLYVGQATLPILYSCTQSPGKIALSTFCVLGIGDKAMNKMDKSLYEACSSTYDKQIQIKYILHQKVKSAMEKHKAWKGNKGILGIWEVAILNRRSGRTSLRKWSLRVDFEEMEGWGRMRANARRGSMLGV